MSFDLPCSECIKTKYHCCKADVTFSLRDLVNIFKYLEKTEGYDTNDFLAVKSKDHDIDKRFNLIHKSYNCKNLTDTDCIFLKDGRCSIYEIRPEVCRDFGTEEMRCSIELSGLTTKEEIDKLTKDDYEKLIDQSLQISKINFHKVAMDFRDIADHQDFVDQMLRIQDLGKVK